MGYAVLFCRYAVGIAWGATKASAAGGSCKLPTDEY